MCLGVLKSYKWGKTKLFECPAVWGWEWEKPMKSRDFRNFETKVSRIESFEAVRSHSERGGMSDEQGVTNY